jgi:hypothetical protein
MENGICPYCQTEEIMWYWEIEPNQWVAVCECCRRAITKAELENEKEISIFITLDEYNAMKELDGGCLGHRL